MKIDTTILLPVTAVVASVLLLMAGRKRIFEIIVLAASAAWLLLELALFSWPLKHAYASSGMILGGLMLVGGIAVYLKTTNKREVTCATAVAILGGMLVLAALNKLG
ncbi:MAG TPA: hypothetical protein VIU61_11230 [Kofleriaceae bacterium]